MELNGEAFEPASYGDAVRVLAQSENALPSLVEDLLEPELGVWVKSLGTRPFDLPRMRRALHEAIEKHVETVGLTREHAALYLGMKEPSFAELVARGLPNLHVHRNGPGEERFLKEDIDAFTDDYLPRFKTWSSRTSLLREFFHNLEVRTEFLPSPQWCEIENCGNLAEVACSNPNCRSDGPPRKICVAHRERIRDKEERSLCAECVRRVLHGDLHGCFRIAGTEARLLQDYPA